MQESEEESPETGRESRIGDRESFTETFREFYVPLVRYACGITEEAAVAEDVVQEVFTKLWAERQQISVETSLKALLYTMVRNRALNANRKRKHTAERLRPQDMEDRQKGEPKADEELETKNLRHRFQKWIQELPPRRKEAFVLSRYHGLSHGEIAEIMEISKRTVDTHIVHALQDLRHRLDKLKNEDPSP